MFCMEVHTCPQVMGICSNLALISSAMANIALFTTPAVMAPSEASSRISPVFTPMYLAMLWAIMGVCSSTEFSSSPRRVPEARPWVSCSMAAWASWVVVPDRAICLFSCSAKAMISRLLEKASPAKVPSFATRLAVCW